MNNPSTSPEPTRAQLRDIRDRIPLSTALERAGLQSRHSGGGELAFPCPNGCGAPVNSLTVSDEKHGGVAWCWSCRYGGSYWKVLGKVLAPAEPEPKAINTAKDWLRALYEGSPATTSWKPKRSARASSRTGEPIESPFVKWRRPASLVHNFRDGDGYIVAKSCRYQLSDDEKIHCQFAVVGGVVYDRQPEKPYPLYNLHKLKARLHATVILSEGANKACAAERLFDWGVGTGWMMGAGNWKNTDFSPLFGRNVILVPDNDAPGMAAMAEIGAYLRDNDARTRNIRWPTGTSEGYDLVDLLRDGGDPKTLIHKFEAAEWKTK